jgi:hypothetical protein
VSVTREVKQRDFSVLAEQFGNIILESTPRNTVAWAATRDQPRIEIDRTVAVALQHGMNGMSVVDAPIERGDALVVVDPDD